MAERPRLAAKRARQATPRPQKAPRRVAATTAVQSRPTPAEAERRQLTVMFCDLVDSTELSERLDPEEWREVVRAYQGTCAAIIERYDGHIAQYLGDGLLVYFGYPTAHEDDAHRAVRAGLGIVDTVHQAPLLQTHSIQVRLGIHTGPAVVGEVGGGTRREQLALGEAPNVAARLQGVAAPHTLVLSPTTYRLVSEFFDCQALGVRTLKGIAAPMAVYQVLTESVVHHRLDAVPPTGLTPLVGREEELALLQRRWEQAQDREGQVVLLSGEPGIGKSRLIRELRNRIEQDKVIRIEFRCSPYYQNSAFHPVVEHLQHLLQWQKDDSPQTRLDKLETTLAHYRFPQTDTLALFAALLSLPPSTDASPLNLSPQRQKQKTEETLIAWLLEEAECAPLYCAWEDLHWADPSTLELLGKLIDQTPTTPLFVLLTSRPEFTPPWSQHGHFSQLTLSRLARRQAPQMIEKVAGGKILPAEVVQQIVAKTDGVPLFVEELTKMVLESGLLTETNEHYELRGPLPPLAIPSTLQDSLMARLDRLASVRDLAQLGATIGREFSYDLLHAISLLNEQALQHGLAQLVEAGLLYQRGTPPQATYLFKHALIQDTAYQSLLKSRRQHLHQQIARVLEERFLETRDTQPELLAYHYTEAGLVTQAIPYWQQAGQRAIERSAHVEAIGHLTKALEVLKTLPDTPERAEQELQLQITLSVPLRATKGYGALEVEQVYARARELCQQLGETPQLFPVLWGLWYFHFVRGKHLTARELGQQCLTIAHRVHDPTLLMGAYFALGQTARVLGEFPLAKELFGQGVALYTPQQHLSLTTLYGQDLGVIFLSVTASVLWLLGYPDQALKRSNEALVLAQELTHPFSLAFALCLAAWIHQDRREGQAAQERAEAAITLSTEQGFPFWALQGTIWRGWALAEQGQGKEGLQQIQSALAAWQQSMGTGTISMFHSVLAEAYEKTSQAREGLVVVDGALTRIGNTGERQYEAELYRLKGELTLQQLKVKNEEFRITVPQHQTTNLQAEVDAEAYILKAIEIARKQHAKSLELRATVSLARLWQQQGKQHEAHCMLAEIYGWFTEGFDTQDLQEAKALLEELEGSH